MVAAIHVAAVRALLARDVDEHLRLIGEIDREGSVDAYGRFYKVAFVEAVRRRFGAETTRGDIIRFVAHTRANRSPEDPDFDILTAERLLLAMLGDQAALQRLSEEDSAFIAPLLPELAATMPHEELLDEAQKMTRRLQVAFADGGREGEE